MKQTLYSNTDPQKWKQKAMAFAVRSHRHLWGKNNEDPLVFLFNQGFNNDFVKKQYMGWNKFGQERPFKTWGFEPVPDRPETLFLPSGIVVPVIENRVLTSLFIQQFNENELTDLVLVPGSRHAVMVVGETADVVVVIKDLFDGLYLYQEIGNHCMVVISPDGNQSIDSRCRALLKNASNITYAVKKKDSKPYHHALVEELKFTATIYQTKEELVSFISSR